MLAPYLASSLVILFKPENKGQFNFIKDHNSIRVKIFLTNTSIPVTLYSSMVFLKVLINLLYQTEIF